MPIWHLIWALACLVASSGREGFSFLLARGFQSSHPPVTGTNFVDSGTEIIDLRL
jgi:hypothetical protein